MGLALASAETRMVPQCYAPRLRRLAEGTMRKCTNAKMQNAHLLLCIGAFMHWCIIAFGIL